MSGKKGPRNFEGMTVDSLEAELKNLLGDYAMEEAGEDNELWIYTGLKVGPDDQTLMDYQAEEEDEEAVA
jgi:hypothetical protein